MDPLQSASEGDQGAHLHRTLRTAPHTSAEYPRAASLAPLPFEILAMIFEHAMFCLSDPTDINRTLIPALSGTCSLFRSIVLESPRLWTFVRLEYSIWGESSKYVREATAHLERSRGRDIWLHITVHPGISDLSDVRPGATNARLRALFSPYLQLERCWRLDIHEKHIPRLHSHIPLQGSFPRLRQLTCTSLQPRFSLLGATLSAPLLCEIRAEVEWLHAVTPSPPSPPNHTTIDLRCAHLYLPSILVYYNQSYLRFLSLDGDDVYGWDTGDRLHLHFPSLEAFSLVVPGPASSTDLISYISAPNLSHLQLRPAATCFELPAFCQTSQFPKLTTLQLLIHYDTLEQTAAFVLAHPSLEALAIIAMGSASWLERLHNRMEPAVQRGATEVLPRLQSIRCHSFNGTAAERPIVDILVALLRLREGLHVFWTQSEPPDDPEVSWRAPIIAPVASRWHEAFGSYPVQLEGPFFHTQLTVRSVRSEG